MNGLLIGPRAGSSSDPSFGPSAHSFANVTAGFAHPVPAAQQSFRTVLDAMAQPGSVHEIPAATLRGLEPPASLSMRKPMGVAMAALLLSLLDADTTLHLQGTLDSAAAQAWLRFHCGVSGACTIDTAEFTAARAADVTLPLLNSLALGSDEAPQRGATLIIEVPTLGVAPSVVKPRGPGIAINDDPDLTPLLSLRGPGVPRVRQLAVGGLARDFWRQRITLQTLFPRGIDLVLTQGTRVAAIPRSTRLDFAS